MSSGSNMNFTVFALFIENIIYQTWCIKVGENLKFKATFEAWLELKSWTFIPQGNILP
jgi:hypothetical protein